MDLRSWTIDYHALIRGATTLQETRDLLANGVIDQATEIYKRLVERPTLVDEIEFRSFCYGFDSYSWLELKGLAPLSEVVQDRVVYVVGSSAPTGAESRHQASYWLKGLVAPTERWFGPQYDKGHFIARSNGGGSQLNIFPQRRDLNRAWSNEGRVFRKMENYCHDNPGTLCFCRPIYLRESLCPDAFDFGVVKQDGELWVAQFENREIPADGRTFQSLIPKGKELNSWREHLRRAAAARDSTAADRAG